MSTANNDTYGLSLRHTFRGHTQEANRIAWSPNGRYLASSSFDTRVCIWDMQVGQQLTELQSASAVYSVAWSSDGISLASCSKKRSITIWNTQREYPTLPVNIDKAHGDMSSTHYIRYSTSVLVPDVKAMLRKFAINRMAVQFREDKAKIEERVILAIG